MDAARLIEGYRSLMRTLYTPREYDQRVLDLLKAMSHRVCASLRGRLMANGLTLARVLLTVGLPDRERGEFWFYMGQVVTQQRRRLADVLTLAVMRYHSRQLTESYGSPHPPTGPPTIASGGSNDLRCDERA